MARQLKTFQIFRAGVHTSSNGKTLNYSDSDISRIAKVYNPSILAAPLVLGHPSSNAPSYGSVTELFVEGQNLYATAEVDDALIDLVRAGLYTDRSAAFYLPDAPINPAEGCWYLRHVGFLGAKTPAVKGMEPLAFGERNPLVMDAEARSLAFAEPTSFNPNPLLADAEARCIRARLPAQRMGEFLFSSMR